MAAARLTGGAIRQRVDIKCQMRYVRNVDLQRSGFAPARRTVPRKREVHPAESHRQGRDRAIRRGLGGLEIVGRHAVEKLLELLHLVLTDGGVGLLVALVRDEQPGLGKHGFLDVDRNADPQCYRH